MMVMLMTTAMLTACSGSDDAQQTQPVGQGTPISFSSKMMDEQSITRAETSLNTIATDFKVYGYKKVESNWQNVFPGYTVQWTQNTAGSTSTNTHDWEYTNTTGQTIKYWDFAASEYRFFAVAPSTGTIASSLPANGSDPLGRVTVGCPAITTTAPSTGLFSDLKAVSSNDYAREVKLEFMYPYAKVRILFFLGDPDGEDVNLTALSLTPSVPGKPFPDGGNLTVAYPQTGNVVAYTLSSNTTRATLGFQDIILSDANVSSSTAMLAPPTHGTDYYYVCPFLDASALCLTANVEGEEKKAYVPEVFSQWKPNCTYTYVFKLDKVARNLQYYDVIIDPWIYGGRQEETFNKW